MHIYFIYIYIYITLIHLSSYLSIHVPIDLYLCKHQSIFLSNYILLHCPLSNKPCRYTSYIYIHINQPIYLYMSSVLIDLYYVSTYLLYLSIIIFYLTAHLAINHAYKCTLYLSIQLIIYLSSNKQWIYLPIYLNSYLSNYLYLEIKLSIHIS